MKSLVRILLLVLPMLVLAVNTQAQQCSTRTVRGTYAVTCDGFLAPAPGQLVPSKLLGIGEGDGAGNFTANSTMSIGGQIVSHYMTTTTPVQFGANCTGTATFYQEITGFPPLPPLTFTLIAAQNGKAADVLQTVQGSVFSCKLTRMPE